MSLVQGNIDQDVKFDPAYREKTLAIYAELADRAKGRLIVLPESALPMFADEVPEAFIAQLRAIAVRNGGDLLTGLFFFEPRESEEDDDRYYNSVVSIGTAPTQIYRKHHLVPFGESIPAKPVVGWLIRRVLAIPLADQTPGPAYPQPMEVAGQRLAVNICYEDAFGGELIRQLPVGDLAGQRHQRRLVRPLARRRAARADERDAGDRSRAADAARDQHRHHVDHRSSWRRARAPAVVHARRARRQHRRTHRRDALCPVWRRRRARRLAGGDRHRTGRSAPAATLGGRLIRAAERGARRRKRACSTAALHSQSRLVAAPRIQ